MMVGVSEPGERERYSRQERFYGIGAEGQRRLAQARLAVVGCGALGGAIAPLLARAGVGFLRLIDRDLVEWSNLPRQLLFDEADARAGRPKAIAAAEHLRQVNSHCAIEPRPSDLTPANASALLSDVDLVLDATDNFEARYLINDLCVRDGRPWIYAAAVGSHGLVMVVLPGQTPCLRCLFRHPPAAGDLPTCETDGVIAPAVAAVGAFVAAEALKWCVGAVDRLAPGLLWLDCWQNTVERTPFTRPDPDCPACGHREFPFLARPPEDLAVRLCGRDAVQVSPPTPAHLALDELAARLASVGAVQHDRHLLRLRTNEAELVLFPDGRALVKGTSDPARARSLYARYLGL